MLLYLTVCCEHAGQTLRSRFRLWERDTGRFGRTSPLMLSVLEPVQKVGDFPIFSPGLVAKSLSSADPTSERIEVFGS